MVGTLSAFRAFRGGSAQFGVRTPHCMPLQFTSCGKPWHLPISF